MNKIVLIFMLLISPFMYSSKELAKPCVITLKIFIDQQLENEVRRMSSIPSHITLTRNNFVRHIYAYHYPELLCNLQTVLKFYATYRGSAFEVYKKPLVARKRQ